MNRRKGSASLSGRLLRSSVVTVVFMIILLASAGRIDDWQAWLYGGVSLIANLLQQLALRNNPDLARERSRPAEGSQSWDKWVLGMGFLLTLATLVVAGLDFRRAPTPFAAAAPLSLAGGLLMLLGSLVFSRAMRENRFFTAVVRIQQERGHAVCKTGPYSVVRHPGYLGMILGTMGLPLLFFSVWAFVPVVLSVMLLVFRTAREDRLLGSQLEGYRQYQNEVRWKLLPGVW